jgi:HK97 family phage major capsid protein
MNLGLTRKEVRSYSLLNALGHIQKGNWGALGIEREASDAIANRLGKKPRGLFVPTEIGWSQRDMTVGTNTAGGFLKGTDHLGDSFVDALRARSVIFDLGARRMSGLVGDTAIPALNAKTSTYWVAESGAPTEGAPTLRQITMSPKTVGCYVDLSRKLMLQSDPSAEQMFRDDMVAQIATAIDSVAINGGGSNEPSGILQTSGIGSVALGTNGSAPTWASVVDLVKEVAVDNAEQGSLAFLTTPQATAKMRSTVRVASTDSKMILPDKSELFGYKIIETSLVPSNLTKGTGSSLSAMIFGNFQDLVVGEWGSLDVLHDPYTHSTTGGMRVTAFMDLDIAVRHAESFASISDMVTT